MGRKKYLKFVAFENGCMVQLTNALNSDGYYRRVWGEGVREMFHRFIWRAHNGDIPEGHEVNHTCRNRACCNPAHLEVLSRNEHLTLTNRGRYRGKINKGKYLLLEGFTKHEVADKLDSKWKTVNNWANQLGWESL